MVSVHRFHFVSEATHRVLNPFSLDKVDLLGEICGLSEDQTMLDLASGKGEMLCRYADRHGIRGTGVDVYEPFVADARARAAELGVSGRVAFVLGEAAEFAASAEPHDVVGCFGATWIGGGLAGTLDLIRPVLRPGGRAMIGEVFRAPAGPLPAGDRGELDDLAGVLANIEDRGYRLLDIVLASLDDWDRYMGSQWANATAWADANPDDPDVDGVRAEVARSQHSYLGGDRDHMGWGVFVLQLRP